MKITELFKKTFSEVEKDPACPICFEKMELREISKPEYLIPMKFFECKHDKDFIFRMFKLHDEDSFYSTNFVHKNLTLYVNIDGHFSVYTSEYEDFELANSAIEDMNPINLPLNLDTFEVKSYSKEDFNNFIIFS